MGDESRLPPRLTRFYGNTCFAADVMANRRISFIHVNKLNDPFDPYLFFETDFDQSRGKLLKYVRDNHAKDERLFRKHVTVESWLQTVADLRGSLGNWRNHAFIFSTSAEEPGLHPKDNLYMWGHYGNGHRGVAIEFNTAALGDSVVAHHVGLNGTPPQEKNVWVKVEYADTFPPLTAEHIYEFLMPEIELQYGRIATPKSTKLGEYYELMGRIKSGVWVRENEWRLMWHNDEIKADILQVEINEESIAALYFGLAISEKSKRDIIATARRNFPRAELWSAMKRHGDFALDFRRLSLS